MKSLHRGKRLETRALKCNGVGMFLSWLLVLPVGCLAMLAGCGEAYPPSAEKIPSSSVMRQIGLAVPATDESEVEAKIAATPGGVPGETKVAVDKATGGEKPAKEKKPLARRKIIYTAMLDLVVEDFSPIPAKVGELARQFDGYIAGSDISGSAGSRRSGSWKVRVPVDRYEKFLDAARGLGELRSEGCDSEDVSDEFYDITSRIRNKQKEEGRLLELLQDATGKLEEILKVERELSRVRGEIERMQGRIRVLNDLTAMTTVNLSIEEIKNYVPPAAPGYGTRVGRTFRSSTSKLISFGQSLSIAAVALTPWMVVMLPPGFVIWVVARRRMRRK